MASQQAARGRDRRSHRQRAAEIAHVDGKSGAKPVMGTDQHVRSVGCSGPYTTWPGACSVATTHLQSVDCRCYGNDEKSINAALWSTDTWPRARSVRVCALHQSSLIAR